MPALLLIILSFVAYANAWPDVLVYDDKELLANGRLLVLSWSDIGRFFGEGLWVASGTEAAIYRPLFLAWMTIESKLFGDWYAGHHLVNIAFHAATTVLVYGLCRQLQTLYGIAGETARWAALLAAAVFAVHPVHAEVVNSIFNGSELFVSVALLGGIGWFLKTRPDHPWLAWTVLNLVYLVALLFRESAASLPGLVVALLWLVSHESWHRRLRQCLPALTLLIPLGAYLYLRSQALVGEALPAVPELAGTGDVAPDPVQSIPEGVGASDIRLNMGQVDNVIRLWFHALKLLLWPHPLQIYYNLPVVSAWLAAGVQVALLAYAAWRYLAKKRPGLLTGLAFWYIALLPSSRIITDAGSPPDLADRLLYLPSAGLSIALAFGLFYVLAGKVRWLAKPMGRNLVAGLVIIACLVLTPLTWARNADWSNEVRLFETDYARMRRPGKILYTLVGAHLSVPDVPRALELCRKHRDIVGRNRHLALRCGDAFAAVGRSDEAERVYLSVAEHKNRRDSTGWANFRLGRLYAQMGRRSEAEQAFEKALSIENLAFMREFMKAGRLLSLYPHDPERVQQARQHLERTLELQPRFSPAREALEQLP